MEETFEQLTQEQEKEFIAVEFRNGHFHTVKAFGVWNTWIGAMSSGLENQLEYIRFVEQNENTDVYDILVSNDEDEARELEIIDEYGGFI